MIVDFFTDTRGRMSVLSNQKNLALLDVVEFDADIKPNGSLPLMRGLQRRYIMTSLRTDPMKSMVVMFLAEFLTNALREETENRTLYDYVETSLLWFERAQDRYANFHLVFTLHISRFLGIYPNLDDCSPVMFYDLLHCCYRHGQPSHSYFLRPAEAKTLPYLFHMDYDNMHLYRFSRQQRMRILCVMVDYYRIHIPGFRELKSLEVLQELCSDFDHQ